MFGDDELQYGVTQKFQPLIIEIMKLGLVSNTRMGQRFREEERISELITNAFFERSHLGGSLRQAKRFFQPTRL